MVQFGGRAQVGCPLQGDRRVSGWFPEAVVCLDGHLGSMGLAHTRPAAPTGVLSPAAVPGGFPTTQENLAGKTSKSALRPAFCRPEGRFLCFTD